MSRRVKKVEVVVDRLPRNVRTERFIEWMDGWLGARHVVIGAYDRHHNTEVAFVLERDMFELFAEMYRTALYMRWLLSTGAPFAVCSEDGCIDVSEMDDLVILIPKHELERLQSIEREIKKMLKGRRADVFMLGEGGRIWISVGSCKTYIYDDEALVLAGMLLDELYNETKQEVFKEMRDAVSEVFKPYEFELDARVENWDGRIFVEVNGCPMLLTHEETLDIVRGLLSLSTMWFMESWIIAEEDWGYE
jgi:hypothetical protein